MKQEANWFVIRHNSFMYVNTETAEDKFMSLVDSCHLCSRLGGAKQQLRLECKMACVIKCDGVCDGVCDRVFDGVYDWVCDGVSNVV